MRTTLAAAAVIATAQILPAYAQTPYDNAGDFVAAYGRQRDNLSLRFYAKGLGDGITIYNAYKDNEGSGQLFCPPEKVGIVEAQYVAIMRDFLAKNPKLRSGPVAVVLLLALRDSFPCKR
jgi:Rap1a immunity proteins